MRLIPAAEIHIQKVGEFVSAAIQKKISKWENKARKKMYEKKVKKQHNRKHYASETQNIKWEKNNNR